MHGSLSQCTGPGSCLHWIQSFWSRGQSPLKLVNIYQINTKFNYLQNKCNFIWSFPPTSELRIISRRHVDRRQVLPTVDRRSSPVDHTARWRLSVTTQWRRYALDRVPSRLLRPREGCRVLHHVYLSVCLSARISQKPNGQTTKLLRRLTANVVWRCFLDVFLKRKCLYYWYAHVNCFVVGFVRLL